MSLGIEYASSKVGGVLLCLLAGWVGSQEPVLAQVATTIEEVSAIGDRSDTDDLPISQDPSGLFTAQVTSVSELTDVQPSDWAFQALQSLIQNYGCLEGYPDRTFRGDRSLTRYEFAAGLNSCLDVMSTLISNGSNIPEEDLATLQRLQNEFTSELAALEGRVSGLEADVADLRGTQFSTTTKLAGEAIFSLSTANGGPNNVGTGIAFNNRLRLNLNTSFSGRDLLIVGLQSDAFGGGFGATGSLPEALGLGDPVFGTASNVSLGTAPEFGLTNPSNLSNRGLNDVNLYKLLYVFPVADRLTMFVGPRVEATDAYPAIAPFANASQGAVSRFATTDNAVTRVSGGTSGIGLASAAGAIWDLSDQVNLTAFYGSVNAAVGENNGLLGTPSTPLGDGLFGGSYVFSSRLAFNFGDNLKFGLNYANSYHQINILGTGLSASDINAVQFSPNAQQLAATGGNATLAVLDEGIRLNSVGATLNWQFAPSVDLTVSGSYIFADLVDLNASTNFVSWLVGLHFRDVFSEGNTAGLIFGQPLNRVSVGGIAVNPENADPYHVEGYFNMRVNDKISITPGVYAVFNPEGQSSNSTTVVGVLRTTFTF
ncbi:iron uptake porin [Nodosilinea nodulosa]|uniref:iron uptake porin n=1 Tax=Nodosilinea nodulosa TaxID=416001 RepID=UPI000308C14E|nr:iron uptake porin [Nodosilinea nodulosa]